MDTVTIRTDHIITDTIPVTIITAIHIVTDTIHTIALTGADIIGEGITWTETI